MAGLLRHGKRLIAPNLVRTLLSLVGGLAVTWMVRRFGSGDLLNRYVAVALVQTPALLIIGWGMRDYLLKALASEPSRSARVLGDAFAGRAVLALLVIPPLLLVLRFAPPALLTGALDGWSIGLILLSMVLRSVMVTLEPLVQFRAAYRFAALAELPGSVFFAVVFLGLGRRTLDEVLMAIAGADAIRLTLYMARFRRDRPELRGLADGMRCLRRTAPFFLVAVAGYFVTRVDVYCTGFLGRRETGQYHVLVNLLQALTLLLSAIPGAFNVTLLRAPEPTFKRAFRTFYAVSVVLVAVAVICIRAVMQRVYGLAMSPLQVIIAGVVGMAFPFTLRSFYAITRDHSQHLMTASLVGGGLCNLAVSAALIARHGVTGALLAAAAGQWTTYGISIALARRYSRRGNVEAVR